MWRQIAATIGLPGAAACVQNEPNSFSYEHRQQTGSQNFNCKRLRGKKQKMLKCRKRRDSIQDEAC
jgi:hypothetical protein